MQAAITTMASAYNMPTALISPLSFQSLELMTVSLLPHHELHHCKLTESFERRLKGVVVVGENDGDHHDIVHLLHLRLEEDYTHHFEFSNRKIIMRTYNAQHY